MIYVSRLANEMYMWELTSPIQTSLNIHDPSGWCHWHFFMTKGVSSQRDANEKVAMDEPGPSRPRQLTPQAVFDVRQATEILNQGLTSVSSS